MSLVKESWKFKYDEALVIENLEAVLQMGTVSSFQKARQWYPLANNIARNYSEKYNIPLEIVCGLIAVLSPQKSWHHNLILTEQFLQCQTCGHLKGQLMKAYLIYNHTEEFAGDKLAFIEAALGGLKTRNFFRNILDPKDPDYITLDFHMCQLLTGNFDYKSPTDKQYEFLKKVLINFAKENNYLPSELQAQLWLIWKENKHT